MLKALLLLAAVVAATAYPSVGVAHIKGTTTNEPTVDGTAYFIQTNASMVIVWINITGIVSNGPDGLHGLHVHEFGDVSDQAGGLSSGLHYIGAGVDVHACENVTARHEGDMGNWQATGGAFFEQWKALDLQQLDGNFSVIGRVVVLHLNPDNCVTYPTGAAGARLATGVIGVANPLNLPAQIAALAGPFTTNSATSADTTVLKAIAVLTPTTASTIVPNVAGVAVFEQDPVTNYVTITARFSGLNASHAYGFHIHWYADYLNVTSKAVNGLSAGGHYDPPGSPTHAWVVNATRHVGDLGNICTYANGFAYYRYTVQDAKFTLNNVGANNILGRNLLVHESYDVGYGNVFGARAAQGVIGVLNTTKSAADFIADLPAANLIQDPICASFAPAPAATTTAAAASTATSGMPAGSSTTGAQVTSTTSAASAIIAGFLFVVVALLAL